mmetsp:Transcript_20189/g.46807  ORF Transcript_20189/g.46807 Transcript_20189/m.46807 type:complete len:94 (-) Transcript_20189:435-716(-)
MYREGGTSKLPVSQQKRFLADEKRVAGAANATSALQPHAIDGGTATASLRSEGLRIRERITGLGNGYGALDFFDRWRELLKSLLKANLVAVSR